MTSEQKPRIFISHRFDDKPIADVIRRNLARWGFDDIYQAGAPGSGPRVGDSLTDELRDVLEDVDLVIQHVVGTRLDGGERPVPSVGC
jgi:hypothetical protein